MTPPAPIPIPRSLRWREFRIRVLPILLFVVALGSAGYLWKYNLTSPALVGMVEVRNAQVSSPYSGKIAQLNVDRFQSVTQGTFVAVLIPDDPRTALNVIQSELNLLQAKLSPHLTQQRNETDYERLRMDWLLQRVDLATARVNLERARNELQRNEELHRQKLISDDIYDIVLKTEQALAVEVLERSNLVSDAALGLKRLEIMGAPQPGENPVQSLMAALQTEEQKLSQAAAGTEPVTLVAPINGMVSLVERQPGENLSAGDPIMTITASEPEHIISFLRQPIPVEPRVGMPVEVRTRTFQVQSGVAHIENVSSHFEGITNALAIVRPGVPMDLGLAIEISLPPGLKVRPGELVDLTLLSND
jgi:multidrug resistance efflux pump